MTDHINSALKIAEALAEKMLQHVQKKAGVISPLTQCEDGTYSIQFPAVDHGNKVAACIMLEIKIPSDNEWNMQLPEAE